MKYNIKLVISYEGTKYQGWQRLGRNQKQLNIQGIIEDTLSVIYKEEIRIVGSGRTDAKVHAKGQVANYHTDQFLDLYQVRVKMNQQLPPDIRVMKMEYVSNQFHSRYDAVGKVYEYWIETKQPANVFTRNYHLAIEKPLDIEKMRLAAKHLVGTHDYAGFSSKMTDGRTTVKTIRSEERRVGKEC